MSGQVNFPEQCTYWTEWADEPVDVLETLTRLNLQLPDKVGLSFGAPVNASATLSAALPSRAAQKPADKRLLKSTSFSKFGDCWCLVFWGKLCDTINFCVFPLVGGPQKSLRRTTAKVPGAAPLPQATVLLEAVGRTVPHTSQQDAVKLSVALLQLAQRGHTTASCHLCASNWCGIDLLSLFFGVRMEGGCK